MPKALRLILQAALLLALLAAQGAFAQVTLTTIDSVVSIGRTTSLAIGADGRPVISYRDGATGELKVARCANAACSGTVSIKVVDQVGLVEGFSSIAIGADGLPVLSYRDSVASRLRVAKCGDAACAGGNTLTTVDETANVGEFNRIRIGADGLPVIVYYDADNRDLKVAKCANAACTATSAITAVDSEGSVGTYASIAIGDDGLPVIAYTFFNGTDADLRVAKCANAACTGAATITTVDAVGDVGRETSIAIGPGGLPVIAYSYASSANLKVARCANAACTGAATITTVDSPGIVGSHTSLAIGADGLPVISYSGSDSLVVWLKVLKCADVACAAGNFPEIVDAVASAGYGTSIAIGTDGLPVISYFRGTSAQLQVAKCAQPGCVPGRARRADFDGDGKSDILWRNASTGENYLYPMNGTAILASEGYLRTVADQDWHVAGIGDFDGDGKADVLWRNASTGENYLYLMSADVIAGEGYLRTVADQSWQVAGVGDLNGDGKDDIVWRNAVSGENYLYPMNGLAILGTEGYVRTVADANWKIAEVGDFDGDGKADLLWRNSGTGENYLYPMDGTTILGTEGYLRTVADANWKIVGTGDFNGDGNADVLWRNTATGENYLYPMNGTTILGTEGYLRTVPDQNWQVKGAGDYDGDGKADVLWRHATSGENYLYFMDGTTIKPNEGYTRTVADMQWGVAPAVSAAMLSSSLYRITDLDLRDPHMFISFVGCRDVTDVDIGTALSFNSQIFELISQDGDGDGLNDLSLLLAFDRSNPKEAAGNIRFTYGSCTAGPGTSCTLSPLDPTIGTTTPYVNADGGTCLQPLEGTIRPYMPSIANAEAPCWVGGASTVTLDTGFILIPLHGAQLAARYVGDPPTEMLDGLIRGFLTVADANLITFPQDLGLIAGKTLSSVLPGGAGNCASHSDVDVHMGVQGWWMYFRFTASRVGP